MSGGGHDLISPSSQVKLADCTSEINCRCKKRKMVLRGGTVSAGIEGRLEVWKPRSGTVNTLNTLETFKVA